MKYKPRQKKAIWYKPTPTPAKRRWIRPVSASRRRLLNAYTRRATAWKVGKVCAYPACGKPCRDVHHSAGRVGRLLLDESRWIPVCRPHHDWIGANPAEARRLGLLCEVGQWNGRAS